METIVVFEAKSSLSEILAAVELGQEFTLTKRGAPIARIIPYWRAGDVAASQLARLTATSQFMPGIVSPCGQADCCQQYRQAISAKESAPCPPPS